jgi:hypothetical protein
MLALIHLKFCKFILGVHKRTTNIAVLSELGRFPLYFNIIKCMLLYWYRLENLGKEFPLSKPQISLPYSKIGLIVWSNTCMLVLIFELSDSRPFFNLKNAFRDFLYNTFSTINLI